MTVTLEQDNFIQWEFELKGILVMVEQLDYVTGSVPVGGVATRSSSASAPSAEEILEQQRTVRWLYVIMVEAISLPIRRLITTVSRWRCPCPVPDVKDSLYWTIPSDGIQPE